MTAVDQMNRIATMIAELSRRDRTGESMPTLTELADSAGVDEGQIKADVRVLQVLNDSAESDWFLSLRAWQIGDQVMITSGGPFKRPIRPTAAETWALAIGLAAEVENNLSPAIRELVTPHAADSRSPIALEKTSRQLSHVHDIILESIRDQCSLSIAYMREGSDEETRRTIHPHELITAEGRTIAISWCTLRKDWRRFRTERILEVATSKETFERVDPVPQALFVPPDHELDEVTVRFAPEVARWLRERYPDGRTTPDGSLEITYQSADPDWLVREVLQYGKAAEVIGPPLYRRLMRRAVG